jgi:hypothetical protein
VAEHNPHGLCCSSAPTERSRNGGVAKSHRSPLVAFLRFQRAVP